MRALLWTSALLATGAFAADFELDGRVLPEQVLTVHLQGANTPFDAATETDLNGKFRFRKLIEGAYVLNVAGRQRTIDVAPSLADSKGRVSVSIDLSKAEPELERRDSVSVRELAIPKAAHREYEEAEKSLGRRDVSSAVGHLKKAVELAPQFAAAWNHLGTIAYQTGHFPEAEADFRKALAADPTQYAPLVNLGGVLINLGQWSEALEYNQRAVARSPGDALANSQLGMTYYNLAQFDLAEKYLTTAKTIDPSHFSHPQMLLAEIHLRRGERAAAARELEDLLQRHPDLPNAAQIKRAIADLRK